MPTGVKRWALFAWNVKHSGVEDKNRPNDLWLVPTDSMFYNWWMVAIVSTEAGS